MSITFDSDCERTQTSKSEPCLCSQMAPSWSAVYEGDSSPEALANLRENADPKCPFCKGAGVESVGTDDAPTMNLSNDNGLLLLRLLGLPVDYSGQVTLSQARQGIMRANSRNKEDFARPEEKTYGKPRANSDGTVDLKPMRFFDQGVDTGRLTSYIQRFTDFVLESGKRGAKNISWG